MQYRRLGRTNLMVAEVGIGTRGLASLEADVAAAVVHGALDAGVNLIEVGLADDAVIETLAVALGRRRPNVVLVATGDGDADIAAAALRRLGTDRFDCYLTDLDVAPAGEAGAPLLVELGLARFAGVSSSEHALALDALLVGDADVVQAPFHLLDAAGFDAVLRAAEISGVGVLACSPLAGGRLGSGIHPGLAEALAFLTHGEPRSIAQGAAAWALSETRLAAIVAGPRTPEHASELVEASRFAPLPTEDIERALAVASS